MIHERLDKGCKAKILHATDSEIMFTASWSASRADERNFRVSEARAYNTIVVSRDYFEQKYGVSP